MASTHPVSNGPRWAVGLAALAVAGFGTALMVLLVLNPWDSKGFGRALGFALLPMIGGFPVAYAQLSKAVRGGRDERLELSESGIAHVARGKRRAWSWHEVSQIHVHSVLDHRPWVYRLGWQFRCQIRFTTGERLRFNGLTEHCDHVADTVLARRPDARLPPNHVRNWPLLRWLLPFIGLVSLGGMVAIGFLVAEYDGSTTELELDDSVVALLSLAGVVLVFGVITSVVYFIQLRNRPRVGR